MKVLLLEDDALVALDLAYMIEEMGHEVIGPFTNVDDALSGGVFSNSDFAVLDFNLGSKTSELVADVLVGKGIPFVFLTGYRSTYLPDRFREAVVLDKPVQIGALKRAMIAFSSE